MGLINAVGWKHITNRTSWVLVLLGVAIICGNPDAVEAGSIILEKIAVTGQTPPGVSGDAQFAEFGRPKINASGQVLIWATLSGADVTNNDNTGLWTGGSGGLEKFMREGELVAGTTDIRYGKTFASATYSDDQIFINDAGGVVFVGGVQVFEGGQWNDNFALWAPGADGRTLPLVRAGDPTVGLPGHSHSLFHPISDSSGWYGIWDLPYPDGASGSSSSAMWYGRDGSLDFTELGINNPSGSYTRRVEKGRINADGWIVYKREFERGFTEEIAVHTPDGTITTLSTEGWTILNGLPGDLSYAKEPDLNPDINDQGQVVFCGKWTYVGAGRDFEGIWRTTPDNAGTTGPWQGGEPEPVVYEGMAAPGMGQGVVFDDLAYRARINNEGLIAFYADMDGPGINAENDRSYWVGQPGDLRLVLQEGDPAPGLGESVTISGLSRVYPHIDDAGRTVFMTGLAGPGITPDNDKCLWLCGTDGGLELIVREGMLLSVGQGDERTVSLIDYYEYYLDQMNDNNQLAIRLEFTDGSSGVFLATVPEPATLSLLALGGLVVLKRRRHA